ncbi:MAG: L,D-transpeptidase family protein [Candidatus Sericytochromatia bacterium]|nr:L,D-transpeptidase family protein [Candidatus Sericytochromatia bacterium]
MRRVWGLLLAGMVALPVQAAPVMPALGPGRLVGTLHDVPLPRGLTINELASRYGVHPIRILRPSQAILTRGLKRNERLVMDSRRIEPMFPAGISGVVLNIPEAQLYRVESGHVVKDFPVGVSRSDWQAPIGLSRVVAMEKNPTWYVPKSIQKEMEDNGRTVIEKIDPGPGNPLGSRWIGFSNGSYGIHGTLDPTSIKRNASHGCVRMLDPQLKDLYTMVSVGMPVYVYYQPVMLAVTDSNVWLSVYPDIYGRNPDVKASIRTLAAQAGVTNRLDWKAIQKALTKPDGIVVDVATPGAPLRPVPVKPTPVPSRSAVPTPIPSVMPTASPSALPTAVPNGSDQHASPLAQPTDLPLTLPELAPQPTPVPTPTEVPTQPL